MNLADFTLETARALPSEAEGAGVYFLWRGDELLYLGSCVTNVMDRIAQQVRYKRYGRFTLDHWRRVPFDRYTVLACGKDEAREIELGLLEKFGRPEFNNAAMPGDPG